MSTVLEKIIQQRLMDCRQYDISTFPELAKSNTTFKTQLETNAFTEILEFKRFSPSEGFISDVAICEQISKYMRSGIKVVSIVTESHHFGGSYSDIIELRQTFPDLLILMKDFILTKTQIDIARKIGADIVLLIARLLTEDSFRLLYNYAIEQGLEVLSEVHSIEDILKVSRIRPTIIGINRRNLDSLEIQETLADKLLPFINFPSFKVIESGFRNRNEVHGFYEKFNAALIGCAAMKGEYEKVV